MPAARVGDSLVCFGGPPDSISQGESTVIIGGMPAARLGDSTSHGGVLVAGCPTVIIGSSAQAQTVIVAAQNGTPFCEECAKRAESAANHPPPSESVAGTNASTHTGIQQPPPPEPSSTPASAVPPVPAVTEVPYKTHGDPEEFKRQLAAQEAALNKMAAGEIKQKIEQYRAEGRPSTAKSAIQKARRKNPEEAKGKAGLHNPDLCIGGSPDDVDDWGGEGENSSIGSQNKARARQIIYDTVSKLPETSPVNFKFSIIGDSG
jgi:hypothetical protein